MAETVKKAKTAAKPRKATSKKAAAAKNSADPIVDNHSADIQEHSAAHANGHERQVSQEEVARLAHSYWQQRGHKHGHHMEDWIRAEQELRGKAS